MIDFSNTKLKNIIVHRVGNKSREEGTTLSNSILKLQGEMLNDLMLQFFLSPFKNDNFYRFQHETDLELNETFSYTSKIFEDEKSFLEQSQNIAKHLYEQSTHPKVNSGEFYAIILEDCLIEDELVNAVGLFKTENKDTYIKVKEKDESFEIDYENGININKLDKGCIIFNTEKDNGYIVSMVDNINKGGEAQYWKDNFL
ncbi:MAG: nucleoid-associated protein, partial [Chlorobi bacterium]|nr:nucleoid-associated protein [Chlorobiota bacterium]